MQSSPRLTIYVTFYLRSYTCADVQLRRIASSLCSGFRKCEPEISYCQPHYGLLTQANQIWSTCYNDTYLFIHISTYEFNDVWTLILWSKEPDTSICSTHVLLWIIAMIRFLGFILLCLSTKLIIPITFCFFEYSTL